MFTLLFGLSERRLERRSIFLLTDFLFCYILGLDRIERSCFYGTKEALVYCQGL